MTAVETLRAQLDALPRQEDIPTLSEQERVFQQRQRITWLLSTMNQLQQRIAKLDARLQLKHNRPWRDALTLLRAERQKQLTAFEARPRATDRHAKEQQDRQENALRMELRIIDDGAHGELEMIPQPLWQTLVDRGFGPDVGQTTIFQARGGLHNTQLRIEAIEHERAALIEQLAAATV